MAAKMAAEITINTIPAILNQNLSSIFYQKYTKSYIFIISITQQRQWFYLI